MSGDPGTPPYQVFLPSVSKADSSSNQAPSNRIVIDPVTRIEGHLRLELHVQNGSIKDAWSAGTMFRGIELVMKDRDPRDAWLIAQRLCGVCTTVHAIASVRAVENALGITVPQNALLLRNILEASQFVHDHVIHFYHLHALDWVDVVSALSADAAQTSEIARRNSPWPNNSAAYFKGVQDRLKELVNSGKLGLFTNGYWGHPAYQLPPAVNLLAVAHYLEALEFQAKFVKIEAVLGGKNPHPQTYLVGGMAVPLDKNSTFAINASAIQVIRDRLALGLNFVTQVYLPDVLLIASYYKNWASIGRGYANYLSVGDFPLDSDASRSNLWLPAGVIYNGNLSQPPLPLDQKKIEEYITHSWYSYRAGEASGVHPSAGETSPNYTGPQTTYAQLPVDEKYSWLKAPRYETNPMEVGPLARVAVAYAAGHSRIRELVNSVLQSLAVDSSALFSTLGRVAARAIETQAIMEKMFDWVDQLEANINAGSIAIHNSTRWDPSTWPAQSSGMGFTEAPRGALGHWLKINNGKIENYQMIIPTTWNGGPRDAQHQRGPWEQALVNTALANPSQPLEVLRTIHSFDPCMACAVHLVDADGQELIRVTVDE